MCMPVNKYIYIYILYIYTCLFAHIYLSLHSQFMFTFYLIIYIHGAAWGKDHEVFKPLPGLVCTT